MNIPEIAKTILLTALAEAESVEKTAPIVDATDVVCMAGLITFGIWLLRTSWGRKALVDSPPRRNDMPLYLPFAVLLVWMLSVPIAMTVSRLLMGDLDKSQAGALGNVVYGVGGLVISIGVVLIARVHFAERLKGFGLNIRTIHKDFAAACLNLLCIWPLTLVAVILTTDIGKQIWGPEFEVTQHEQLDMISKSTKLSLQILIFVVAAFVAPVVEEIIFRGLIQTMVRSFLSRLHYRQSGWMAIAASSTFFAAAHQNTGHWPALFILALCMGYSYEKSGSLFRPIFIHALFNAGNIIMVLTEQ